jgi:hypothetical protein
MVTQSRNGDGGIGDGDVQEEIKEDNDGSDDQNME